ncbi:MAG: TonB-dependent receptor [Gammaproteobacteria bacterium]|nr:TonB-dependent receptor [Gammaproteobacteria bacterium]MDH3371843.1 TonB-dependent receptor [Gammaproteobacteria bacterium]
MLSIRMALSGIALGMLAPVLSAVADNRIEEIVVTAQKKASDIQDVPLSVTAITARQLDALKLRDASQIVAFAPNVTFNGTGGENQLVLSVRGVSMQDYAPNQAGPVAVYADEIYRGNQVLAAGMQMFDLERVEVLRGPQGTLYGRNSTGGAINLISNKPRFEGQDGYLTLGAGNYGRQEAEGAYESEIVDDRLAFRGAFSYVDADGYVENQLTGEQDLSGIGEWGARLHLAARLSNTFDALLTLYRTEYDAPVYGALAVENNPAGIGFTGYLRSDRGLTFHETEADRADDTEREYQGVSLRFDWELSDTLTLTSITSYDEGEQVSLADDDGSPFEIFHSDYSSEIEQVSQDLRLVSNNSSPFNYVAGLYYVDDQVDATTTFRYLGEFGGVANFCFDDPLFFIGCAYTNELTQDRESLAAYIHTTTELSERWSLTVGLRYTDDTVGVSDYSGFLSDALTGVSDPLFGGAPIPVFGPVADEREENDLSGKVGLEFRPAEDLMVYGSFSTAYRAGAWNGQAFFGDFEVNYVPPEEVETWEFGVKSQLLDGRLQINGAVFIYDYKNQQFLDFDPLTGAQTLASAEEASISGGELEMVYLPMENLTLNLGIGLLDTEYDQLVKSGVDLSGNKLIAAPETNINAAIDYDFSLGAIEVRLRADGVYTGDQFYSVENLETIAQDGYWLWNARAIFSAMDKPFSVGVWVKNLTDDEYIVNAFDLSGFGYNYYQRGAPRTYGIDATWRF